MAGLTAILIGIPLPVIGIILFIIAIVMTLRPSANHIRNN
jgi:uncharacterized membrane protein